MALKTAAAHRKDISTAANGVTLEHRHFAFIAATLKDQKPTGVIRDASDSVVWAQWRVTVGHFAAECARTNPKFNRARFLAACGVED